MLAFRSLLIPAVAAVMNLLAYRRILRRARRRLPVPARPCGCSTSSGPAAGPIESFLPVLMLAVLFGLSMDYEVFLVSRIREEWAATGDNHHAVRTGQATTGRVIIAAATIMILVFSAFILSGQQAIGEIGIGLAAAVLLDAFLLRTLLVPALMHLTGRGELVAATLAGPRPPPPVHRTRHPATRPAQPRARKRTHPQHDSPVVGSGTATTSSSTSIYTQVRLIDGGPARSPPGRLPRRRPGPLADPPAAPPTRPRASGLLLHNQVSGGGLA